MYRKVSPPTGDTCVSIQGGIQHSLLQGQGDQVPVLVEGTSFHSVVLDSGDCLMLSIRFIQHPAGGQEQQPVVLRLFT